MLTCPLCKNQDSSFHKRSHLLPEWMFQDIYECNKLLLFDLDNDREKKIQKGTYDSIICKECELNSQIYDRYGSLIFTDRSPESPEHQSIKKRGFTSKGRRWNDVYLWSNIDFHKLQKFIFICVLRTHFSFKHNNNFLLIDKHLNKLIDLYIDNSIVDDRLYPIIVSRIVDTGSLKKINVLPFKNKRDGHHCVEFKGGYFLFSVFVSSHRKSDYIYDMSLKKNGTMYVTDFSFLEIGTFAETMKKISRIMNK
jgi:hypothetical protein